MHRKLTKELYDAFPPESKSDFWSGYLYLKYTEHFFNKAIETAGMQPKELPPLDPAVEEMLSAVAWQVADNAMSAETSLYHGKVVRPRDIRKFFTIDVNVNVSPPERVVPFKVARDIVIDSPEAVAAGRCPCRSATDHPCLGDDELDVCLFIGEPWVSFMDEENETYHRITRDKAVDILESCHDKGFVHTAYFEHAAGNRMDAICNCCSCCCMGMRTWNMSEGAIPLLAPSGYVAEVSEECSGCGICAEGTCNFFAIDMSPDGNTAVINEARCMGCEVCETVCPVAAISMRREPAKGDPLDLDVLLGRG